MSSGMLYISKMKHKYSLLTPLKSKGNEDRLYISTYKTVRYLQLFMEIWMHFSITKLFWGTVHCSDLSEMKQHIVELKMNANEGLQTIHFIYFPYILISGLLATLLMYPIVIFKHSICFWELKMEIVQGPRELLSCMFQLYYLVLVIGYLP